VGSVLPIVSAALALAGSTVANIDVPSFERYRVKSGVIERPANVQLSSHPKAPKFRTVLADGAKTGPNFAGHYTIVTWGCGVACAEVGVVDARTGQVFFPRQLQPNAYQSVTDQTPPFQYRLESNLLIVAGSPLDRGDNIGIHYYLWNGRDLKELLYVPKQWR
jgi:hypothetical protein